MSHQWCHRDLENGKLQHKSVVIESNENREKQQIKRGMKLKRETIVGDPSLCTLDPNRQLVNIACLRASEKLIPRALRLGPPLLRAAPILSPLFLEFEI